MCFDLMICVWLIPYLFLLCCQTFLSSKFYAAEKSAFLRLWIYFYELNIHSSTENTHFCKMADFLIHYKSPTFWLADYWELWTMFKSSKTSWLFILPAFAVLFLRVMEHNIFSPSDLIVWCFLLSGMGNDLEGDTLYLTMHFRVHEH